jgi:hypothetical protein
MSTEGKPIRLTILQRYTLARILPTDGDFWQVRAVKRLRDMLKTTAKEREKFGAHEHPINGGLTFDDDEKTEPFLAVETAFKVYPSGLQVIREALRKLDRDKKMAPDDMVSLYEKFMPEDELKAEEPMGERCEEVEPDKIAAAGKAVDAIIGIAERAMGLKGGAA